MEPSASFVVILGMHRSGTSICARICEALGVYLGTDLISGQADNPDGFWEDREIVDAQESILRTLDRVWWSPKGALPLPSRWWLLPECSHACTQLRDAAIRLCRPAPGGLSGFKDPRTIALLAFWKQLFQQLGIKPKYVLSVRAPGAVCASLAVRNRLSELNAELLWLQHVTRALEYTADSERIIVSYEHWLEDFDRQVAKLAKFLGPSTITNLELRTRRLRTLIDPQKNHAPTSGFTPQFPLTLRLHSALQKAAQDTEISSDLLPLLDQAVQLDVSAHEKLTTSARIELPPQETGFKDARRR